MIVFDHVSKVYPNGTVGLDDVDLTIADGEFAVIIGRSGAGKSTLLRSVNRMHRITSGTLTVNGTDVSSLSGTSLRRFRRRIGMVPQSFNLVTRTSVIQNVMANTRARDEIERVEHNAAAAVDTPKALTEERVLIRGVRRKGAGGLPVHPLHRSQQLRLARTEAAATDSEFAVRDR